MAASNLSRSRYQRMYWREASRADWPWPSRLPVTAACELLGLAPAAVP